MKDVWHFRANRSYDELKRARAYAERVLNDPTASAEAKETARQMAYFLDPEIEWRETQKEWEAKSVEEKPADKPKVEDKKPASEKEKPSDKEGKSESDKKITGEKETSKKASDGERGGKKRMSVGEGEKKSADSEKKEGPKETESPAPSVDELKTQLESARAQRAEVARELEEARSAKNPRERKREVVKRLKKQMSALDEQIADLEKKVGEGEPVVTSEGGGGESAAGEFTPGISDEVRQKLEDAIDEEYKVKTEGSDEAEEVAERKARERELKLLGIEEDYEPDAKEAKRRAKQKEKARAERWRAAAEERDRRKQEIGVVDKIAKSLGLEVRLYEGPAEENGYIQGNTIYVNSNAAEGEGLRFVAGHEMTHSMEDAAVAAKRKEAYDQAIAEGKSAEDAERAAQEWEDHYRSTGEGLEGTGRVSRHR